MAAQLPTIGIIIITLAGFLVSATLKILSGYNQTQKFSLKLAFTTGGMPSSHSSTVTALTASIFMHSGLSATFVLSLFFSIIVMMDAAGVRRQTGKQGALLNAIIAAEGLTKSDLYGEDAVSDEQDNALERFNENMGHTPKEVIAGAFIGLVVALGIFFVERMMMTYF
ncbi:MAG: divergent PAP2 family protein [Candidatus Woesearchaeota archaeon]